MKKCKGNYRTDYFKGCGTDNKLKRTYGLCPLCLYEWSKSTSKGSEWYQKNLLKTKKKQEHEKKKEKTKNKIESMSITGYWSKVLQPNINLTARLIDHKQPCIATGNDYGQMHGGHYISVGSNRTLSLNLHNIHQQSAHSNKWKSGDDKRYAEGLKNVYGIEYLEFIESFNDCPLLKLSKQDLIDINKKVLKINIELRKDLQKIESPSGRILERNRVNCLLGIYPDKYLTF